MVIKRKSYNFKFDYNMFQNDIHAFIHAHNLKCSEMDELCGVGTGTIGNILNGRTGNHKMATWLAIANTMDIDVRTYFVLDV